jgi:hypothetical protein
MFGKRFTVWGPAGKSAVATVKVQVDSAAPVAATVTGSSASYGWSAAIGRLTRGTHTLKATLYLGGAEKATATTSFVAR